jgi:uncharacterized protein with von Willebrand factor type A (vWA) domain
VLCYQQSQLLSTSQFVVQLPQILTLLDKLRSPFRRAGKRNGEGQPDLYSGATDAFLTALAVKSGGADNRI